MAQLKEKKQRDNWAIRGTVYKSKSGEEITIVDKLNQEWVKILNPEGKLEVITKDQLEWRLGYGLTATRFE